MHPTTIEKTIVQKPPISSVALNGYHKDGLFPKLDYDKSEQSKWLHDPAEAMQRELGPYTVADMEKYIDIYPVELYNGWLVWQEMGNIDERISLSNLQMMFDLSARKSDFGQTLPDGTECCLDDWNDFVPDCSLISWHRLEKYVTNDGPNERPILIKCPELIVESRPTSDPRAGHVRKREKYFTHGASIIWDFNAQDKFIDVYHVEEPERPQHFTLGDVIDCEPILPGWRRRVADIFARRASAEAIAGEIADEWCGKSC